MRITLLLLFLPLLISSYNLDETISIKPSVRFGTMFSVSVMYSEKHNSSVGFKSWLITGYPGRKKGPNNDPGMIIRTSQQGDSWTRIEATGSMSTVVNATSKILLTRGWYGVAMDVSEKDGSVTVCAPRTTLTFWSHGKIEDETLQGVCYSGSVHSSSFELKDFPTYSKPDVTSRYKITILRKNVTLEDKSVIRIPQNDTTIPLPVLRCITPDHRSIGLESVSPIIGSPMHQNVGAVHTLDHRKWTILEEYAGTYLPLFGYAISSGNYFDELQLMVAGGAPGWNFVGQVAIMNYYRDNSTAFTIRSKINGTELGEFFGASLATGDLNNDGLDDLIVGSPHWKNDNGRVYIYLGNKGGFSKGVIVLEGSVDDALYGYSLSCGDLDNDGFDDIIVSAPWEGPGAIYVYNGDANLEVHNSMKFSQKIKIPNPAQTRLFGFSLSKPVDVDDNGFPDIAISAHGTEMGRIISLSKPVVKTIISLWTIPDYLHRTAISFKVQFCVNHEPPIQFDGVLIFSVDKRYNRVSETVSEWTISTPLRQHSYCSSKTFFLLNNRNNVKDIEIVAEYQFNIPKSECKRSGMQSDLVCPIKYKNQTPSNRTRISFYLDCGGKRTCQASISAKLEFQGISNSTYTIGSNDLNLLLMIKNDGEPAYAVSVVFYIPEGVALRRLLPSCHKKGNQHTMMVKCDVGDLLTKDIQKNISLGLDMSSLFNASLNETTLNFTADIKTRSANQGQSKVVIALKLEANVSIALSGKSYNINRYFEFYNKPSSLDFQHNYEISQFGVTPISKIFLKVLVPSKVGCFNFLTITQKPRVSLSSGSYQCRVRDTLDSKTEISADKLLSEATVANQLENLRTSVQNSRTTRITKADADANQLQCENIRSQLDTQLITQKSSVINLDCFMPNVICKQVECEISFVNTAYGFGRLPVQLNIGISELIGHTQEQDIAIHFTTEASVHVLSPIPQFGIPGSGNSFSLTTTFNFSPNPIYGHSIFNTITKDVKVLKEEVSILIILSSILVGLLLLGLLVVGLKYMGFFERKKKNKMKLELEMHVVLSNNDNQVANQVVE